MSTISEQRRVGNRLCPLSWFAEPSILRDQGREGVAICAGSSMGFVIPCIFSCSGRSSVPSCAPIPFWSRSPLNFDNRISLRALRLQRLGYGSAVVVVVDAYLRTETSWRRCRRFTSKTNIWRVLRLQSRRTAWNIGNIHEGKNPKRRPAYGRVVPWYELDKIYGKR